MSFGWQVKLVSLENRDNKLSDDLWGEETGLAKVMHDLSRTNEVVAALRAFKSHQKASKTYRFLVTFRDFRV